MVSSHTTPSYDKASQVLLPENENLKIYKEKDKAYYQRLLKQGKLTRVQIGQLRNKGLL